MSKPNRVFVNLHTNYIPMCITYKLVDSEPHITLHPLEAASELVANGERPLITGEDTERVTFGFTLE